MKRFFLVLLGICATACVDGRSSHDRIELRVASGMTARLAKSGPEKVRMTYMGRTILAFDGPNIYVDGRIIEAR
jgi:hypothetical protein